MTQQLKLEDTHIRNFLRPEIAFKGLVIFGLSFFGGRIVAGLFANVIGFEFYFSLWYDVITIIIVSMFMFLFGFRKKILHIIIEKSKYPLIYKLITYINYSKYLIYLLFLCMFYIAGFSYELRTSIGGINMIIILLLMILVFVVCFTLIFGNPLTKEGIYLIQYTELDKNFDDFIDRQKWLRLICRDIQTFLKKGNIWINHDLLLYRINIGIKKEPKKISDFLEKTKKWFLFKVKKDDLLIYVGKILSEPEIIFYDPLTIYEKVRRIPLEYIRNTVGVLIFLILMIYYPERTFELLKIIGENFM